MTKIFRDELIRKSNKEAHSLADGDNSQISLEEHHEHMDKLHKLIDQLRSENTALQNKLAEVQKDLSETTESQYQNARREGYKAGFEEGLKKSKQEFSDLNDSLNECCTLLKQKVLKEFESHKYALFTMLQSSLTKILGEAYTKSETIVALISQAIQTVDNQHELVIYLHRYDYNRIKLCTPEIQAKAKPVKLTFAVDDSIQAGGCILKSQYQGWDAQLSNQLSSLLESISFLFDDK
ncbi:hypothetical protein KCM76_08070 [Zooshikella marina]|uniref:FliH/SctL family protein n=1 Tax=Zooshikella ganghwensis TaxID=202772 RepID=UPI001BB02BE0|nr:FliH/SctL family protein [Zooshikella ganghwensis]MBU2705935.1 hypothetical protein [Zooshikella ganghwensis]